MAHRGVTCLEVAVALPVEETYTYSVPAHLAGRSPIGTRVRIPFGNQRTVGYVIGTGSQKEGRHLKDIQEVLDNEPLFHKGMVPFFRWMADYYLHPIGPLIQAALPAGLNVRPFKSARLTQRGEDVLSVISPHSEEHKALQWIRTQEGKRLTFPPGLVGALQKRGWIEIRYQTPKQRTGPLMRKFVRLRRDGDGRAFPEDRLRALTAKNEAAFIRDLRDSPDLLLGDLRAKYSNGDYLVRKWKRKGWLDVYEGPVLRNPAGAVTPPTPAPLNLNAGQGEALRRIEHRLQRGGFSTNLLHGVTGSGKTEVYIRAIEKTLSRGRQAILMVPEISLANYMEGVFRSRLGDRVAVYHSGLGAGERYETWLEMARGEKAVVVGARSALFAPFPDIGLVVVDEEHDASYKQEEAPRYQARDAAIVRGRIEKALVILGSGTPSVQSYHNALSGRHQLISMPERIEKRPLPEVRTIDMKELSGKGWGEGAVSPPLREALDRHLERGKQVILFLNRRGFDRVHLCRSCGEWVRCHNCDLALTYHLREDQLACHYCGFRTAPQTTCPSCGKETMTSYGFGTERLEHELAALYPEKRIIRMDRDSTRRKGRTLDIIKKVARGEVDILVGTQMITKGYDFPNVTLVGVIAADGSLGFPDFRAGERSFQLLSQVAGRAGRGEEKGTVIVQTFNPSHYAITTARDHDFQTFYERERELREQLGYPPFSHLACLRLQGKDATETAEKAEEVGRAMADLLEGWPKRGKEIQVLGPVEAPLARLKGRYRRQILVKCKASGLLHFFLRRSGGRATKLLKGSGVELSIDVDPYQML